MFSKLRKIFQNINWTSWYSEKTFHLLADDYIQKNLFGNPAYSEKLNLFEYQVFSQNGEDGIIREIFKRIGVTNKYFIEFGVENGMENNTHFLLNDGWSGLWIEGDKNNFESININFNFLTSKDKLKIRNEFVTRDNIEKIFSSSGVPKEIDLLSIDIDGNDYWIWSAIENYSPRVVVTEYNSHMGPDLKWVMKYNPELETGTSS